MSLTVAVSKIAKKKPKKQTKKNKLIANNPKQ